MTNMKIRSYGTWKRCYMSPYTFNSMGLQTFIFVKFPYAFNCTCYSCTSLEASRPTPALSGARSLEEEPRNMHLRFKTLGAASVSPYVPPFKEAPRICLSTVIDHHIYFSNVHIQSPSRPTVGKSHTGAKIMLAEAIPCEGWKAQSLDEVPAPPLSGNVSLSRWFLSFWLVKWGN